MKIYLDQSCSYILGNNVPAHAQCVILVTSKHLPNKVNIHDILLILLSSFFKIRLSSKAKRSLSSPQEVSEYKNFPKQRFFYEENLI